MTDQPKRLTIDVAKYDAYLADADLTEVERRQVLEALWSIIVAFVDLGFEVHPAQTCGQAAKPVTDLDLGAEGMVNLKGRIPNQTDPTVGKVFRSEESRS